jgi:hypothetical protein
MLGPGVGRGRFVLGFHARDGDKVAGRLARTESLAVDNRAYRGLTSARRLAYHPPALAERLAAADGKESIRMWNDLFIRRVTPPIGAGVRGRSVPISS